MRPRAAMRADPPLTSSPLVEIYSLLLAAAERAAEAAADQPDARGDAPCGEPDR